MAEIDNLKIRSSLFSGRHGYTKLPDICVTEGITGGLANAICDGIFHLRKSCEKFAIYENLYANIQKRIWVDLLCEREEAFPRFNDILTQYILQDENAWYKKFDVLDYVIEILYTLGDKNASVKKMADEFATHLSMSFENFNYGYRVVDGRIVPITSEEEKKEIERAIETSEDEEKTHLEQALVLYAKRPDPDYRNSIKESISAVEALLRKETSTKTLGDAIKDLKRKGTIIPDRLIEAYDKLYAYTNDKKEGIRHSLMDIDHGGPGEPEAHYMLIVCSAFINYVRDKKSKLCEVGHTEH